MMIFCVNCGSWVGRSHVLCEFCQNQFVKHFTAPIRTLPPLNRVWSQFRWQEESHPFISRLITYTKAIDSTKKALRLPLQPSKLLRELLPHSVVSTYPSIVWIPIPSTSRPRRSHYLCYALSHFLGGTVLDCLHITSVGSQKRKKLRERWNIHFSLNLLGMEDYLPKPATYIFVDDVITTGATLQNASQVFIDHLTHSNQRNAPHQSINAYGVTIFSRFKNNFELS